MRACSWHTWCSAHAGLFELVACAVSAVLPDFDTTVTRKRDQVISTVSMA